MFCRVIPYEGTEPYIFLSYCHKDAARVYPIIEQLARGGHRIWYDEGNHPGDDWLENIARHLDGCTVCLAMLTENAAASHNCRSELSFAVECKKTILAVVMEEFAMPLGMRMQLSAIQHLKHRDDMSEQEMLEKLYEARDLAQCRAESAAGLLREYTVMQGGTGAGGGHVTDEARVNNFVTGERRLGNQGNNGETETAGDGEEPKTGETTCKKKFIITKRERRKLKKSAANSETETPAEEGKQEIPVIPEDEKPAEEVKQETPVIPEDEKPVEEVEQETPVIPEVEKPVEEVKQEIPATPEEEKPVEEEEQETPVVPEDEKPVEEVEQETPVIPEDEKPVEEVQEAPATPEEEKPVEEEEQEVPVIPEEEKPVEEVEQETPVTPEEEKPAEEEEQEAPVIPEVEKLAEEVEQETPVIPEDEKPVEEEQETPVIPEDEKPVEEVEQETPVIPEDEKPAEEVEQETPVTPEDEKPVEEVEQETPVIPEDEKPVEEEQETPVIPEDEKPVEEAKQEIPATPEEEKPVEEEQETPVIPEDEKPVEEEQETPVIPEDEKPVEEEQETPVIPEEEKPGEENGVYAILFHPASGSCYYLKSATVRIGRTAFHSDIAVKDGRFLDEHHADLIWENGQCFVQDAGSFRGTFVNHRRLPAQERVALEENDIFFLHTEAFQIVCGNAAKELMAVRNVISLTNRRNAETRVLPGLRNSLGREVKIAEGFFRDTRISRNHADIYWRDGTPFVCDIGSTNGTVLNNERLERDREYVLRNGDLLRLGDTVLVVHITTLRGEEK